MGYSLMKQVRLSGVVEGDGTALRLFRTEGKNNYVALWGLVQRPSGNETIKRIVFFVPVKSVSENAVCPVESYGDASLQRLWNKW